LALSKICSGVELHQNMQPYLFRTAFVPESPWGGALDRSQKTSILPTQDVRYIYAHWGILEELPESRMRVEFQTAGHSSGAPEIWFGADWFSPSAKQACEKL
jgi:hypothetical protein